MSRLIKMTLIAVAMALFPLTAALAQVDIGFGGANYDASQPVEITSDTLDIDQANGEAIFTGNVLIVQGDLRMTAGRIRVVYGEANGQTTVQEVLASGGVLVTQGTEAAEGAEARYSVGSAVLTISGNVLVTQGPTALAGDRLLVNLETGRGQVEGRVRTILDTGPSE